MKRRIALLLLIGMGTVLLPISLPQVGRAAQTYPSCSSFGIQRFEGRKEAPAFSLKTLDGGQVSLSDFKGKPLLVVFWATW